MFSRRLFWEFSMIFQIKLAGRTKQGKIRAKVIKSFELKCAPAVFTNKVNVC